MEDSKFLKNKDDMTSFRKKLDLLLKIIEDFQREESGAISSASLRELETEFQDFTLFPETGVSFEQQKELLEKTIRQGVRINHPYTAAHLHCPPLADAAVADLFISVLNLSMDSWDQSGVGTIIETMVLQELGTAIYGGTHRSFAGVFTDGGTRSNLMGLMFSRERFVMSESGRSVFHEGLPEDFQNLYILCSESAHFSAQQAAGLLGLGRNAILALPTDESGRLPVNSLEQAHSQLARQGRKVICVFATAGTTDHGAIDQLDLIADFCDSNNIWMHVDAAVGGALLFTARNNQLRGIERARSVSMDFHKLFFQPIACGAFFLREKADFELTKIKADYLNREDDPWPNLVDFSLSTTRRFDVFKLLLSMRGLGRSGFSELIERLFGLTRHVRDVIIKTADLELYAQPQMLMVLFRYQDRSSSAETLDYVNAEIRRRLLQEGLAIVGQTRLTGKVILKLTLMNPDTSKAELSELLYLILRTAEIIKEEKTNAPNSTPNSNNIQLSGIPELLPTRNGSLGINSDTSGQQLPRQFQKEFT